MMTDAAIQPRTAVLAGPVRPKLDGGFDPRVTFAFSGLLAVAILFVALLTALGFEFVNGFHDTANAVAA